MQEVEKAAPTSRTNSGKQSRLGLIMGVLFGAGTVVVGVPVWKEMSRQINARIEMEVATRLHEATKEGRREGFLDAVCAARETGMLELRSHQGPHIGATGSYSDDAETARREIQMATDECRSTEG